MKSRSIANFASVAALAAMLPLGTPSAHAVSSGTVPVSDNAVVQPAQFQRVEWTEEKRAKLRRAYFLLEHADGDYAGHRVKAMEHLKKAGEIMKLDLHGNGYGATDQLRSDERIRKAREYLKDVAEESGGKEFEHLRQAIRELDHALEVK